MHDWQSQVDAAAAAVASRWPHLATAGVILGTGLGELARRVDADVVIPYREIPHFPHATALGHQGRLVCGRLAGTPVITMEGRCHIYEGYPASQIALPVRVMHRLGARLLIVSNAAGGLNPRFRSGDIMLIADHVNLTGGVPGIDHRQRAGGRPARIGPLYDPALIERSLACARTHGFPAHQGVYVGVTGPNYETRAEYRMFRAIGGDAVGMSTVPEALAAAQSGMRVLALSMITNVARPDAPETVDAHAVLRAARRSQPYLSAIVLAALPFAGRHAAATAQDDD